MNGDPWQPYGTFKLYDKATAAEPTKACVFAHQGTLNMWSDIRFERRKQRFRC